MGKPTEDAEQVFGFAKAKLVSVYLKVPPDTDRSLELMAMLDLMNGLINLSVGVRATYMLLEEVKMMLQRSR